MTDTMGEILQPQQKEPPVVKTEKEQRIDGMKRWVQRKVLTTPFEPKDVKNEFVELSIREKADVLYGKLMAYHVTDRIIHDEVKQQPDASPEPIDPYLLSEIQTLWTDPATQVMFLDRFTDARIEAKFYKQSELGQQYHQNEDELAKSKEAFEAETRSLYLGQATRPDQIEAARGRVARLSKEVRRFSAVKDVMMEIDPIDQTKEKTDIAAQVMFENLSKYHDQAKEGFVWLPSRDEIHSKTIAALQNGRWPMLIGEAGTGKSEQADAAAVALTGEQPTHLSCSPTTSYRDLIADRDIDPETGGSYETYGPAMQAATGYTDSREPEPKHRTGRIVRFDESGRLGEKGYTEIKALRQKRPTTSEERRMFKEKKTLDADKLLHDKPVLPGFAAIWTTNPVGSRYPNRSEPDAALRRELAYIQVDYPPMNDQNPELYEFMIACLMDNNHHISAAREELAPAYQAVQPTQEERTPNGRRIIGREDLINDSTDSRHGTLYRLSFALRSLQDAFNNGNAESIPEHALRYTQDAQGRISVIQQGGDPLTLNNSTITLGEVASWMRGFQERRLKDDTQLQTSSLTDYLKVKLETYLDQTDNEDREKIRAILDHYKLFGRSPDLKNAKPIIPSEIGYLSPRVPRPLHVEKAAVQETAAPEAKPVVPSMYQDIRRLMEDGRHLDVRPEPITLVKDGKDVHLQPGKRFKIGDETFRFDGLTSDLRVVAFIGNTDLVRVIDKSLLEQAEFSKALSEQEAKEIMGDDFFGVEEVQNAFFDNIFPVERVPEIPWTAENLEAAKARGEFLILRIDKTFGGDPYTMEKMQGRLQPHFNAAGVNKGKVLYDTDWYKDEDFFKKETPQPKWALVSKEVIPQSTNKNYLQQTERIAEYLRDVVYAGEELPDPYKVAIAEFNGKKAQIQGLMSSDWKEAARQLANLGLNRLTRQKPVETLYDTLVYFQNRDERLLENMYTWNNTRSSNGGLVLSGAFKPGGLGGSGGRPDYTYPYVGVVVSR